MPPSGRGRKKILVVAEAPGEQEDRQGVQLVGNSGRQLESTLRKFGVNMRQDCWLTNAAICRPPGNELHENAIDHCRPNLVNTVNELKPNVIITLGESALRSVLGAVWKDRKEKIGKWTGWRIPLQKWNCWVCPTWHPAYLLRAKSPVLDRFYERHLAQAVALADNPPWDDVPDYRKQVSVLVEPKVACRFIFEFTLQKQGRFRPVAFDFETDRLKPDHPDARIVSCAVSDGRRTVAYPWTEETAFQTKMLLRCADVPKFGWNMKFEERWCLKEFGHGVRGWAFDGMTAAHVLDNRPNVVSLKFQAFAILGEEDYSTAVKPFLKPKDGGGNSPNRITELPLSDLLLYNGLDALLEWTICRKLWKQVHAKP
jgi:DNA polymerase